MKTSGELLEEFREAKRLSQDELAEMVGCGKSKISKLENGQQVLNLRWAKILAPALGRNPLDFFPDLRPDTPTDPTIEAMLEEVNHLNETNKRLLTELARSLREKQGNNGG